MGIIHNLLHSHALAVKTGVGQIHVCRSRVTGKINLEVAPFDIPSDDEVIKIYDVTSVTVDYLAVITSNVKLSQAAKVFAEVYHK